MKYLLDSDALSILTNPNSESRANMEKYLFSLGEKTVIYLCYLTVYEFEFSISSCSNLDTKERINKSLTEIKDYFSFINLGFEDAKIYGELKAGFRKKTGINQKSLKRHNLDIALASIAIANNCIIVSKDKIYKDHLQKIDNRLQCESW